jgi:hypothetical protein
MFNKVLCGALSQLAKWRLLLHKGQHILYMNRHSPSQNDNYSTACAMK